MGLSNRAYARHRGVSETAVRKALKTGRIVKESDGTIDPLKADKQWEASTLKRYDKAKPEKPNKTVKPTIVSTAAPVDTQGTSFMQARTANEVYKAKTNQVKFEQLKGELVQKNNVMAHVFKLARQERDAWQNWPARVAAQMASELQVENHTMLVILEQYVRQHLSELSEISVSL